MFFQATKKSMDFIGFSCFPKQKIFMFLLWIFLPVGKLEVMYFNHSYHPPQSTMTYNDLGLGVSHTLPKTNIAPTNGGFQQESPFPGVYFQGLC